MWVARNNLIELLEPKNYLMTNLGDEWSVHADQGLIHAYEYWSSCLDSDHLHLELKVDRRDVLGKKLRQNFFSDADHATEFSRKSTCGSAAMIQGDYSRGLIDFGCKQQNDRGTIVGRFGNISGGSVSEGSCGSGSDTT